jgi:two-component system, NtrC family, sensor kinase
LQKDINDLTRLYSLSDKISKLVYNETPLSHYIKEILTIISTTVACKDVRLYFIGEDQKHFYSATLQPANKYSFKENINNTPSQNVFSNTMEFINSYLNYSIEPSSFFTTKNRSLSINKYKNEISQTYKSIIFIPFFIDEKEAGLFELIQKRANYFSDDVITFYEAASQIVRISIEEYIAKTSLKERVKELSCLYQISKIAGEPSLSIKELIKKICSITKTSFKYPDLVTAKIVIRDHIDNNPQVMPSIYISEDIFHRNEAIGYIKVSYPEKVKNIDMIPFLKEEIFLLKEIARQISIILEERTYKEDTIKIEAQLRHADRLSTVGELASGVAHELNEPLGNILGFAQLIQKDSNLNEQVKSDIDKIIKASLYSREIIKNLLTFAHQVPTNFTMINLNKTIVDGLFFFKSRCEKEGVVLNKQLAPNLPNIKADPSQINQIIVNLVVNAIQAMPKGGLLKITTYLDNNNVIIHISDTGIGIKKSNIKKIFDPFFTTKEVGKGTGLGLSVVHGIIKAHKGKISVSSIVNEGTTFTIKLPIEQKDLK